MCEIIVFVCYMNQVAINRIIVSKFGACAGQACITIDYVLVEDHFLTTVVRQCI